jgi:Carbohydrate binding domain
VFNASNAQNLATNPGFEDGTTGWEGASLTTNSFNQRSGNACGTSTVQAYGTVARQFITGKLQAGQTYNWSIWLRAATQPSTVTLHQTDSTGDHLLSTETVTTIWTKYSVNFSLSGTGAPTDVSVFIQARNFPLTLYLDDVSITNTSPQLALVPANQSVLFSWPITATNYTLQTTTNLTAPFNWVAVTNAAQSNAVAFSVTLPSTSPSSFFRLQHP